ncbi:tetratricopeptide repeat protein, partial [Limnospira indica]
REVSDRAGDAGTLTNIGGVYHGIGQPQEALTYFQQALPI